MTITKQHTAGRIRILLEDHGQDFLWLEIKGDEIVGCGPFQAWLWVGKKIVPPAKWQKGSRIVFADGNMLHYPVTRAKPINAEARSNG